MITRILCHPFALGWLTTLLVMPGPVNMVSDSPARLQVTHQLWTGDPCTEGLRGRDGRLHPHFGIGHSFVMLPGDVAATVLLWRVPLNVPDARFKVAAYLTFPVLNGLTLWAASTLLAVLGFGVRERLAGMLALLFASSFLWHCQNNQENPLQLLLVLLAATAFVRYADGGSPRWLTAGAAALGFNLLIRLPGLADLVAISLIPAVALSRGRTLATYLRHSLIHVAPVVLMFLAADRAYHYSLYGTLTDTYVHRWGLEWRENNPGLPESFPFSASFWEGFGGAFLSPGKSVFIYDPLLILATAVTLLAWRMMLLPIRAVLVCGAVSLVLTAAGYARYVDWGGDACWGDRFVATPVHLLALLAVPCWMRYLAGRGRPMVAGLIAVAVGMQLLSILLPAWVELVQAGRPDQAAYEGHPPSGPGIGGYFQLGMRMTNLAAGGQQHMIVPLLPLDSLPFHMALAAKCGWFALLGLLVTAIALSCRRAGKSSA